MKRQFITLILALALTIRAQGQTETIDTSKFVVTYDYAVQTKMGKDDREIVDSCCVALMVGTRHTMQMEYYQYACQCLGDRSVEIEMIRNSIHLYPTIYGNYPDGKMTTREFLAPRLYVIEEPMNAQQWTLTDETLEEAGEPAQWVAFVERGCFKYMVHNDEEGKDYCTGFAFEGEFVADFPYCLDGDVSEVSIEADMPCEVRVISGQELQALFDSDPKMAKMDVKILKNLFKMVYGRDLDHYRYTARSRYRRLIDRCPQVVQMLSLKDIASFLNITPIYLSKIRKELTFGQEKG